VRRVLGIFMVLLIAGCTAPKYPPSKTVQSNAVRIKIVPDPSISNKYRLECDNCDSPAAAVRVDHGDWIGWKHEFDDKDVIVMEFSKPGDDVETVLRAMRLFGLGINPNFMVTVAVKKDSWTWLRVSTDADLGEHGYGVQGMSFGDPGPGLIVCPPGQTCP
jgi:hypothetical protein